MMRKFSKNEIVKSSIALTLAAVMGLWYGNIAFAGVMFTTTSDSSNFNEVTMYVAQASTEPLVLQNNTAYEQVVTNGNSSITVPATTTVDTLLVLDRNTMDLIIAGTVANLNLNENMRDFKVIDPNNMKTFVPDAKVKFEHANLILKDMGYENKTMGSAVNSNIRTRFISAGAVNCELCVAYPDWAAACRRAENPQSFENTVGSDTYVSDSVTDAAVTVSPASVENLIELVQ